MAPSLTLRPMLLQPQSPIPWIPSLAGAAPLSV